MVLPVASAGAEEIQINQWNHKQAGFSIEYPADWQLMHTDKSAEGPDWKEKEQGEKDSLIESLSNRTIFELYRYPQSREGVNPGLKVTVKKFGSLKGMKAEHFLYYMTSQFRNMLKDFSVIEGPAQVQNSKTDTALLVFDHSVDIDQDSRVKVRSMIRIYSRNDHFFVLSCNTEKEDSDSLRIMKRIADSVRIDPR